MSLRRFDGWEPTTTYTYDDAGRLVSSTTEPEWDEEQQALMLALARWRDLSCRGCGGWIPDTTEKAATGAYVPQPPVRCHRCAAFAVAAEATKRMSLPESLILQVNRRG